MGIQLTRNTAIETSTDRNEISAEKGTKEKTGSNGRGKQDKLSTASRCVSPSYSKTNNTAYLPLNY
jgi:hypothetical protein